MLQLVWMVVIDCICIYRFMYLYLCDTFLDCYYSDIIIICLLPDCVGIGKETKDAVIIYYLLLY